MFDSLFIMHKKLTTQVRARKRARASARAEVRGKGHAKVRAMGPGLRPEITAVSYRH